MAKTKTFPHAVIYHGCFYPANTPIVVKEGKQVAEAEEKTTKKAATKK